VIVGAILSAAFIRPIIDMAAVLSSFLAIAVEGSEPDQG
jgi:hypothetical protein